MSAGMFRRARTWLSAGVRAVTQQFGPRGNPRRSSGAQPLVLIPSAKGLLDRFSVTPEADASARQELGRMRAITLFSNRYCSHGCTYCVSQSLPASRIKYDQIIDKIGKEAYLKHVLLLAGGHTVRFGFNGPGECAEHPAFEYLLRGVLDAGHRAYIQTHGLTSRVFERILGCYARSYVAERVSFGLSFHLGAYLDDDSDRRLRAYLDDHYPRIAHLGAPIWLIVPLTPRILACKQFDSYLDRFKQLADLEEIERFRFVLIELQGVYCGKKYPAAFSEQESRRIVQLVRKYGGRDQGLMQQEDVIELTGPLYLKGLPCYVSTHSIEVTPGGLLRHCLASPQDNSARLTDPQARIHFTDGPITCPYDKCLCKSAGIRNCLAPLGVPLKEYFREIEKDISRHGKNAVSFYRLSAGPNEDMRMTEVAAPWQIPGHLNTIWLSTNFTKPASGYVQYKQNRGMWALRIDTVGEGNFKVFPYCGTSGIPKDSHLEEKAARLWHEPLAPLLLDPGAYLIRVRVSGKGRLEFLSQVFAQGEWNNCFVRSYDLSDVPAQFDQAVLIPGKKPLPFRPVFGMWHEGRASIQSLELFRAE